MSAGFSLSHGQVLNNNIRHIYSGYPTEVRFRVCRYTTPIDPIDRHQQQRKQHVYAKYLRRTYEYVPQYGVSLPKAPAFKHVPNTTVHEVTTRLYTTRGSYSQDSLIWMRSKSKSLERPKTSISAKEDRRDRIDQLLRNRPRTAKEVNDITDRLYRSHTAMSLLKYKGTSTLSKAEVMNFLTRLTPSQMRSRSEDLDKLSQKSSSTKRLETD
ncbi:hypothetical protein ACJMK2_043426 [Sinanodonta woodiana]|uniref:Uncharacterized protein n=1 Tax=Sinanodonta woodiana TaxID=1069815 RepID=A0ABD3VYL1_SINWO